MDNLANIFSVLTLDAEDDTDQITTLVAAKEESNSSKSAKDGKKGELSGKETSLKDGKKGESSGKENSLKDGKKGESSGKETSLKDGKKGESSEKENSLKDGKKGESSGKENSRKDGKKGESSGKETSLKDGKKGESSGKENSLKDGKKGESSGKETSLKDGKKGESSGKENSLKDGKKGESLGEENSRKDGKKGESSGKENSLENGRLNQESLASSSRDYKMPLVWIDLEMTGLDVTTDRILEIACVLTDGKLTKSIEGPDFVVSQTKECMDKMGEWCREHHAASGLTERVLQSTISERDAEKQVIEFVKKHIGSDTPLLAGNSIYVDFLFLKKYMPDLAAIFPHVLVDVSSVMALCIRWFPREKKKAPQKEKRHRAMDDIKESIRELKYYKESIFKSPKSK